MKIIPHRPDLGQKYSNPFKDKRVYPFNKIGRVVVEKTTGDILLWLGENDSKLTLDGAPWTYNENLHDIMVHFPAFYYKRNWNGDILEDSILTDLPKDVVSDKVGYEIFPVFVREDGTIRPYVLYGAFKGVELGGQLRSVVGYKPTVNKTISAFRDLARQGRDSRWNIETFGIISMVQFLYKIAFQDLDSQKILGNGWTSKTASAITGSTMGLGNRCGFLDPFENSPDKPHESISMSFQCVDGELVFYNKKDSDPMPIKTTNMAGLQKWEETEDYTIYLCKDATMTVVENYVTGTFQEFQERKAQIEANQELMKSYLIEWTEQDSIDLINDINNKALMSLALKPTTLDLEETPNEIQVLSPRAVPVTYECCFRMDKKSGEFYIGEGYENLWSNTLSANLNTINSKSGTGIETISYINKVNGGIFKLKGISNTSVPFIFIRPVGINQDDILSSTGYCSFNRIGYKVGRTGGIPSDAFTYVDNIFKITNAKMINTFFMVTVLKESQSQIGEDYDVEVDFKNFQITKTSTPKLFVKSVMPSGKLTFVTGANETTHTFLNKGDGVVTFGNGYFSLKGEKAQQLLVYNALLTEQEKQAELAKDIKATDNQNTSLEYPANGNQISLFGIEDFYGNIWSFADGFFVKDDGYYITNEPNKMGILSEHIHYPATPLMGTNSNEYVEGYFKTIEKGASVYNIPNLLGSSGTKNYTDYLWSHRRSQTNICLFGTRWTHGVRAGAFCLHLNNSASYSDSNLGTRLVFCP